MNIPSKLKALIEGNIAKHPFIMAVDGPCASGKTTLAGELNAAYGFNVVHMDDFYLPFDKRGEYVMSLPGGHMDYDRLLSSILLPLSQGKRASYIPYDCHHDRYLDEISLDYTKGTVVEGSYSLHPSLRAFYSVRAFLDIKKELQLTRLAARNKDTLDSFKNIWIPREEYYFEKYDIKKSCNIILQLQNS